MKIGVLALQGNFEMHCKILEIIGIEPILVKYSKQLDNIEGIIIPGGESTTMSKLMHRIGFYSTLMKFANDYPVLGTCAGLILMAEEITDSEIEPTGLLAIKVRRNGYGRQINSNTVNVNFDLNDANYSIPASFIRAPKIISWSNSLNILAEYDNSPVIVKNGKHVGITFHPELDDVTILHEHTFLHG